MRGLRVSIHRQNLLALAAIKKMMEEFGMGVGDADYQFICSEMSLSHALYLEARSSVVDER